MSESKSYSRILKSSSLIGGAQGINMLIGMVRVKFVAILLGPEGVGLLGMLRSIQTMAATLSGMGIDASGVREVAKAHGADNAEKLSRTVLVLRRICWLTGIFGAVVLVVFCRPLSKLSFKSPEYATDIALLGLVVIMISVSAGQRALIQGTRRIGDLARLSVISAVAGTIAAVGCYVCLGMRGIIIALLLLALIELGLSFWFSRRLHVEFCRLSWRDTFVAAGSLITLGLAFMWSGLLGAVSDYLVRYMVIAEIGLAEAGIYGAAFRLSGMLMNFVLQAMGTDFYPGLTAISDDDPKIAELVNQQTEIGILLAVPGLLATYAFAPFLLSLFYSSEFMCAKELIHWFTICSFFRVLSWPMGYVFLAKGQGGVYAAIATFFEVIHIVFTWLCLRLFGLEGVAIAYLLMAVVGIMVTYALCVRRIRFHWSREVLLTMAKLFPTFVIVGMLDFFPNRYTAYALNMLLIFIVSLFCLLGISNRLEADHRINRALARLPLLPRFMHGRSRQG